MRVVFMGTPAFAATILEYLCEQHEVVAVYTRPDAVRGRGKALVPSPVKQTALERGVEVFTPTTLKDVQVQEQLASFDADVFCVAAYGMLLPKQVLDMPRYGCLNAHASLLPRWRGAAPIERAILAGDERAGVCVMRMEEGLDTGDYCVCRDIQIEDLSAQALTDELAVLGAQAMLVALGHIAQDCVDWTVQDEAQVVYAHKIEKHELDLSAQDTAVEAWRKVRASSEAHPCHCVIGGKGVTLLDVRLVQPGGQACQAGDMAAGSVALRCKRLFIGTSDGMLEIMSVKPDGKKQMEGKAFAAGLQGVKQGTVTWEVAHG